MIKNTNKVGFTLIELLVVVLIIGILSSVALPQYQKAVMKSRANAIIPLIKSSLQGLEAYYMANGTFTREWDAIDVSPNGCTHNPNSSNADMYSCGNDWLITLDANGMVLANYCPSNNSAWSSCNTSREFQMVAYSQNVIQNASNSRHPGAIGCYGFTTAGIKKCKDLSNSGQIIAAN